MAEKSDWKERYKKAHEEWSKIKYPTVYKDGHYSPPNYPKVTTANGLTKAIKNYTDWIGGIGNRITTAGRMIDATEKQPSGTLLIVKKYIPTTTKKGTADVTCLLPNGKTLFIEVKVFNDKPSKEQLLMQEKTRKANGIYEFIHSMDEFFQLIDKHL